MINSLSQSEATIQMKCDPKYLHSMLRDSEVSRDTKQLNNLGWKSQQLQDFSRNMQQLDKIWLRREISIVGWQATQKLNFDNSIR